MKASVKLTPLSLGAFAAVLAAIALAVSAWYANAQRIKLEQERLVAQQTRAALEQASRQSGQQARALDEAVQAGREYDERKRALEMRRQRLHEGWLAGANAKTAMTEFYFSEGKWPDSNQAIGLPPPGSIKVAALQSLAVAPGGKIQMKFAEEDGATSQLWLTASTGAANLVSWQCVTPDIPDIAELIPGCAFQAK